MDDFPITDTELERLENCLTSTAWALACLDIKKARGGVYPRDWWDRVKLSGLMDRVLARWGGSSELRIVGEEREERA